MGYYSLIIVFSLLHFASSNPLDTARNRSIYFNSSNSQPYSLEGDFIDGHALSIYAKFEAGAAETLVLKLLTPTDRVSLQFCFNFTANETQLSRRDGRYLMTQSDVPLNWPSRDSFQFFIVRHNDYFEVHGCGSEIHRIWIPSKGDGSVDNLVKFNISGGMTMDRAIYEAANHSVFFKSRNGSVENLVKFNVSGGMTMDRPIYEAVNHSVFFQSSNRSSDKGNLLDPRNRYIYFNSSNSQPYSLDGDFVVGHALNILASFILGAAKTLVLSFLTAVGEISLQLSFDFKANRMRSSRRRDGRLINHSVVSLDWPSRDSFDFSIVRRKHKFLVHGRDSIIDTILFPSEGNGSVENFVKFNVSSGMTMDRAIYEAVNHSVFFQSSNGSSDIGNLLDTRNRYLYFSSSNSHPNSLEGDFIDGHALSIYAKFKSDAADTLVLKLLTPTDRVSLQFSFNFTANEAQLSRRRNGRLITHSVVPLDWPNRNRFDFYIVRHNNYFVVHGTNFIIRILISSNRDGSVENLVKFNISGGMTMDRAIYEAVNHSVFFHSNNGSSDIGNPLDTARNRSIYFNSSSSQPYSLEGDFIDGHALSIYAKFKAGAAETLVLKLLTSTDRVSLQFFFNLTANEMRSSRRHGPYLKTQSVVSLDWPNRDSFDFYIVRHNNYFVVHGSSSIIRIFISSNWDGSVDNIVKFNVSGGMTMDRAIYEAVNHSVFFQSSNLIDIRSRNRFIEFNSSNLQPYSLEGDFVDGHALHVLANFTSGAAETLVLKLLTPTDRVSLQFCFNFTANEAQLSRRRDGRLITHSVVPLDWPNRKRFNFYIVRHNNYFVVHGLGGIIGKVWISSQRDGSIEYLVKLNISGGMTMDQAIYKAVNRSVFFQSSTMTQPDCDRLPKPLFDVPYIKMPHELNRSLSIIMKPYLNGNNFYVELYDRENILLIRFVGHEQMRYARYYNQLRHEVYTYLTWDTPTIKIINDPDQFAVTVKGLSVGYVIKNSQSNPLYLRIYGAGYVTGLCLS